MWLKTIYTLFFIDLGTRRVHLAGCTTSPDATWVTQQARQLVWNLKDYSQDIAFLIHEYDKILSSSFDTVFSSEGIEIVHTPFQAPRANAFAERWVRSVRQECLDHILILNESHLRRVLKQYSEYYNYARPHQGIDQRFPVSRPVRSTKGPIRRLDVLGGVIHDYYRQPSAPVSGNVQDFYTIQVSKILGHSKASTTLDIYGHLISVMQEEAAKMMDELITPIPIDLGQEAE